MATLSQRLEARIRTLEKELADCQRSIEEKERRVEAIGIAIRELRGVCETNGQTGGWGAVPNAVRELISRSPHGLNSSEVADSVVLSGVTKRRSDVHQALFNLKKRGGVRFEPKSGKYFPLNG